MPKRAISRFAVFALCLLVPILQGGCPDFRNSVVDAADTTTRDLIFGTQDVGTSIKTGLDSVLNAALDLFFGQFRSKSSGNFTAR